MNDHHRQGADARHPGDARYQDARRVTVVGAVVNIILSIFKVLAGWLGSSHALIADGIHSLSDLATDVVVLIAAKHGSQDADAEHPYGHARIETLATALLGVVLILVALGIGYDATRRLFAPANLLLPGMLALTAAIVSVLSKEALYQYTVLVAKRLRSNLLRANAWHHRSDAVSSVVVVVGVLGSMAGLAYLDAVASVLVAAMVAKIGWDLGWQSIHELIDRGLEQEDVAAIRDTIMAVDGVRAMHDLRTRRMGGNAYVDVDVLVDPTLTVSEGHRIGQEVWKRLVDEMDEVTDVTIHIDPEDDETEMPNDRTPLRPVLLERLQASWRLIQGAESVEAVALHYLGGKIRAEVRVSLDAMADLAAARGFARAMAETAEADPDLSEVRVLFSLTPSPEDAS